MYPLMQKLSSLEQTSLHGLNKKDGGIRPIAIGNTLRCLVAKCAGSLIKEDMQSLLSPLQLNYRTPRGRRLWFTLHVAISLA